MNVIDIIESNKRYVTDSGFNIEVDFLLPSVNIYHEILDTENNIVEKTDYFFLQEHEAQEFIDRCFEIENMTKGEIDLRSILLSECKSYVDNL